MLGVEFAQLGMALVQRQGGIREVDAMLTSPPLRRGKDEEKEEEEGASLAQNWTGVNVRHTVSRRRSCSRRSRTWAASCAAGPGDTTPSPSPRCWQCRGGVRHTSTSG